MGTTTRRTVSRTLENRRPDPAGRPSHPSGAVSSLAFALLRFLRALEIGREARVATLAPPVAV